MLFLLEKAMIIIEKSILYDALLILFYRPILLDTYM